MFEIEDNASARIYHLNCENTGDDLRLLEKSIEDFIISDNRSLIIDLSGQQLISSLLLAILIKSKRELVVEGRGLALNNCNSHIYRCMELAGLENFFTFTNNTL